MNIGARLLAHTVRLGGNPAALHCIATEVDGRSLPQSYKNAGSLRSATLAKAASERMSAVLGERMRIGLATNLSYSDMKEMVEIGREAFTRSLQYEVPDLVNLIRLRDFIGVIARNSRGELAGFAMGFYDHEYSGGKSYYLAYLVCGKAYRGRWLGKTIFDLLLAAAKEMGYNKAVGQCPERDIDNMDMERYYMTVFRFETVRKCGHGQLQMEKRLDRI